MRERELGLMKLQRYEFIKNNGFVFLLYSLIILFSNTDAVQKNMGLSKS